MYICVAIYFQFSKNCPSYRFLRDSYDSHYVPVFHGSPTRWNLSTQAVSSSVTQSWFVPLIVFLTFPTWLQGISFKRSSQHVPLWFSVQATLSKIRPWYENPCVLGSFCCCDKNTLVKSNIKVEQVCFNLRVTVRGWGRWQQGREAEIMECDYRKECLLDTAWQLHIWTHGGYDQMHKTCVSHSQTKSWHGGRS